MKRLRKGALLDEGMVLRLLRAEIAKAGGQSTWAKRNGVNRSNLNSVLHGRRRIAPMVLAALGLRKVSAYTWLEENRRRRSAIRDQRVASAGGGRSRRMVRICG